MDMHLLSVEGEIESVFLSFSTYSGSNPVIEMIILLWATYGSGNLVKTK